MVEGIIVAEQSDCKYAFSPELNGGVQIDDILWDFGDGNTSNQTNPMHSYNNFGNYEVTMTISDSNGCCTRKTTIVDCNEPICDYYACWAWENLSMQNVNRISGFTLIDENNVEQNIELFSPHINNNGGYYQLYDAIKDYLILNHGFTLSQFKEMDPEISCHKNGEPTVGYFIEQSHIKLVSIDGFLDWEGTIGFELEFLTKNCQ